MRSVSGGAAASRRGDTRPQGEGARAGAFLLNDMGARGFEPPTFCSQSRRAADLRYAPG